MVASAPLTEAQVRALASPESFRRGHEYYQRGAVESLVRRGNRLEAEVAGSQYEPYQVTVTLGPAGIVAEDCTCPYDWGGACKHVVATLLAYLDDPDAVEERPPLATVLAPLDRDQLQQIVLSLADDDPALAARVEVQAAALQAAPRSGAATSRRRARPPAVDPTELRRRVRAAIRSLERMRPSEAYWHVGGAVRQVVQLAEQARPFFEAGDVQTALTVLEAVTEEYLGVWMELDDSNGEAGDAFRELGELWAEAFLSGELTPAERDHWEGRLADWQGDLEDYGVDDAFVLAETALQEGWDAPEVVRALRGEAPTAGTADPVVRPGLADIRLKILDRQGRTDEYLRLAAATGRRTAYAQMLLRLGRVAEAVEYSATLLTTPAEALALAQALYGQGAAAEALRVAERGLTLETPRYGYAADPGDLDDEEWDEDEYVEDELSEALAADTAPSGDYQRATLARWLRDVAHAEGESDLALRAAAQVVRDDPGLADYLGAQTLAGERWPALREELLAQARGLDTFNAQAKADIFLHEGLLDDAIAVADAASYQRELVEQVADAVVASHPDWVIRTARARAHAIIESGSSGEYEAAARWLARWRDASREVGREREWRAYLDDVLDRHRRKYKLIPLLRDLAD